MPEADKQRMSVWVEEQDRQAMKHIKAVYGLSTDSAAIRFAVRFLGGDPANQRRAPVKRARQRQPREQASG